MGYGTEPVELYATPCWEVLDPNEAKLIAVFYDEGRAREYQAYLNYQIAKQVMKAAKNDD